MKYTVVILIFSLTKASFALYQPPLIQGYEELKKCIDEAEFLNARSSEDMGEGVYRLRIVTGTIPETTAHILDMYLDCTIDRDTIKPAPSGSILLSIGTRNNCKYSYKFGSGIDNYSIEYESDKSIKSKKEVPKDLSINVWKYICATLTKSGVALLPGKKLIYVN